MWRVSNARRMQRNIESKLLQIKSAEDRRTVLKLVQPDLQDFLKANGNLEVICSCTVLFIEALLYRVSSRSTMSTLLQSCSVDILNLAFRCASFTGNTFIKAPSFSTNASIALATSPCSSILDRSRRSFLFRTLARRNMEKLKSVVQVVIRFFENTSARFVS